MSYALWCDLPTYWLGDLDSCEASVDCCRFDIFTAGQRGGYVKSRIKLYHVYVPVRGGVTVFQTIDTPFHYSSI